MDLYVKAGKAAVAIAAKLGPDPSQEAIDAAMGRVWCSHLHLGFCHIA
jgi:hypothetical protein